MDHNNVDVGFGADAGQADLVLVKDGHAREAKAANGDATLELQAVAAAP